MLTPLNRQPTWIDWTISAMFLSSCMLLRAYYEYCLWTR